MNLRAWTNALFALLIITTPLVAQQQRPGWLGMGYLNRTRVEKGKVIASWFVVRHVIAGGPAARAGLHVGDLVTAIDGQALRYANDRDAVNAMSRIKPGQKLRFAVARGDLRLTLSIVAVPMPDDAFLLWQSNHRGENASPRLRN
jgi:S1-C subfamily serine protease